MSDNFFVLIPTSLLAGAVTFMAPCALSVLPLQIGYIVSLRQPGQSTKKLRPITLSVYYIIGFTITFLLIGLTLTRLGSFISHLRGIMQPIAGIALILLGLTMLTTLPLPLVRNHWQLNISGRIRRFERWFALLLGASFAFTWSPCIGPVLALILYWASQTRTFWQGFFLLFCFSLGFSMPFLLLIGLGQRLFPLLPKLHRLGTIAYLIVGCLVIVTGFMLTTRTITYFFRYSALLESFLYSKN